MIAVFKRLSARTIRSQAKKAVKSINEWFAKDSTRQVCQAEVWYGRRVSIRREYIEEDINKAAEAAIKG